MPSMMSLLVINKLIISDSTMFFFSKMFLLNYFKLFLKIKKEKIVIHFGPTKLSCATMCRVKPEALDF
jgi:hypothetical protein